MCGQKRQGPLQTQRYRRVAPKIYLHLESMDGTLLGSRVFADVIKLQRGHTGLEGTLNAMTDVFRKTGRSRETEVGHVTMMNIQIEVQL